MSKRIIERRRVDLGFGHTYVLDSRKVPKHSFLVARDDAGRKIKYWDYPGRGQFAYKGERLGR